MDLNYALVAGIVVLFVILVYFIVKRNQQDLKKYEKESNAIGLKPEKHQNPKT